jgi:uncharacterized protein (TIGR02996 family)
MIGEALYQSILDDPDDDGVRLVYADWLDENGDPERAEFIRVQCELERLCGEWQAWVPAWAVIDPHGHQLAVRSEELLKKHGASWQPAGVPVAPLHAFRRGFVESIAVRVSQFIDQGADLARLTPYRSVTFTDWEPRRRGFAEGLPALASSRHLARIRELRLNPPQSPPRDGALLRLLLQSAHLTGLRRLFLPGAGAGIDFSLLLSGCASLGGLRTLDLAYCQLGPGGLDVLCASGRFPRLEVLNLSNNPLGGGGVRTLAFSPLFARLRRLNLRETQPGVEGLQTLAASLENAGLFYLNLDYHGGTFGDEGAIALAFSRPRNLQRLSLAENEIGPAGLRALLRSPVMEHLAHLDLKYNPLGDDGAKVLAESESVENLVILDLHGCGIGNTGIEAIAGSGHLAKLRHLTLMENPIGSEGAHHLARSPYLQHIEQLAVPHVDPTTTAPRALKERFGDAVVFV